MLKWNESRLPSEELRSYALSNASSYEMKIQSHSSTIGTQTESNLLDRQDKTESVSAPATQPTQIELTEQPTASSTEHRATKIKQASNQFETLAELVNKSKPDETSSQLWSDSVEEDEQMKAKAPQESVNKEENQAPLISEFSENHLVSDLLLALIMAHNLHQKKRSDFRINRLYESMITELTYRSELGRKYKFSSLTDLDHQISLAKEIQCNHSFDQIFEWSEGSTTNCHPFCLLNFPPLNVNSSTAENDKMTDVFIQYFKSIITSNSLRTSQRLKIIDKLKADLISRGYHTTYNWVHLRMKAVRAFNTERLQSNQKKEAKPEFNTSRMVKWIEQQAPEHKCPAIDERILDLLDNHLSRLVLINIKRFESRLPQLPIGISQFEYFYHLTCEFIKHNKGWTNTNSLTDTGHLKKMERYTRVHFPDTEALQTLTVLKAILSDFRNISKPT